MRRLEMGKLCGKRFWMANLAVSLILQLTLVPLTTSLEVLRNPSLLNSKDAKHLHHKRDTSNPPFPFAYSDEAEEGLTTTNPLSEEFTTLPSSSNFQGLKNESKESSSRSIESDTETTIELEFSPTDEASYATLQSKGHTALDQVDLSSAESAQGTTYTSLLSPLPSSPSTTFSSMLINKTARTFASRVGVRGLEPDSRNGQINANSIQDLVGLNRGVFPTTSARGSSSTSTSSGRVTSSSTSSNRGVVPDANSNEGASSSPSSNPPLLRAVRPTLSVISYNPSNYNRVVKRRKITSISGRNLTRSGGSIVINDVDGTTTNIPDIDEFATPTAFSLPEESSQFSSSSSSSSSGSGSDNSTSLRNKFLANNINDNYHPNNSNNSKKSSSSKLNASNSLSTSAHSISNSTSPRAIAGFSIANRPSLSNTKIVTKGKPKPIVIRDHESVLFRNSSATTDDIGASEESWTSALGLGGGSVEDETVEPPTGPSTGLNTFSSFPFKVKRVKVTMSRIPVVHPVTPSPINIFTETATTKNNNDALSKNNATGFSFDKSTKKIGLIAEAAHEQAASVNRPEIPYQAGFSLKNNLPQQEIRPEKNSEYRQKYSDPQTSFSSRKVYKEEFGIHRDSYGTTDEDYDDDDESDMDSEATTTEHYQSLNPSPPSRTGFSVESSMSEDDHVAPLVGGSFYHVTPKYRDYFSDVPTGNGNEHGHFHDTNNASGPRDNLNHLYSASDDNGHHKHHNGSSSPISNSGKGEDNNGAYDSSSPVTSVTVTVTKTIINQSPSFTPAATELPAITRPDNSPFNNDNNNYPNNPFTTSGSNPDMANLFNRNQNANDMQATPVLPPTTSTIFPPMGHSVPVKIDQNHSSTSNSDGHELTSNSVTNDSDHNTSSGGSNGTTTLEKNLNDLTGHGTPGGGPLVEVISSKDVKGVYFTKVEHPHYSSSSYEFTTSKTYSYFVPDSGHGHEEDGGHDDHEHDEGDHGHAHDHHSTQSQPPTSGSHNIEHIDQAPKAQELVPTTAKPFWDNLGTSANASSTLKPIISDQVPGYTTPQIDTVLNPSLGPGNYTGNSTSNKGLAEGGNSTESEDISLEIGATEQNFPDLGSNKTKLPETTESSQEHDSNNGSGGNRKNDTNVVADEESKVHGSGSGSFNGVATPGSHFPVLNQIPIFVKMVIEIPKETFCSHLTNFKEMIVMVYAHHSQQQQTNSVAEEQITIFTDPNCTATTTSGLDPGYYESGLPPDFTPARINGNKQTSLVNKTTAPVSPGTTLKTPLRSKTTPETVEKTDGKFLQRLGTPGEDDLLAVPTTATATTTKALGPNSRRKRRGLFGRLVKRDTFSTNKSSFSVGESLILDRKSDKQIVEEGHPGQRGSPGSIGSNKSTTGQVESFLVYFFLNDKKGNYDQDLTMAFVPLWNLTSQDDKHNSSHFNNIFYQKVKEVDMVSSSQLVSPDDPLNENSGIIAAIAIASIAAACLFLIGVLLLVLRHRQAQIKFAKRCTPVTLDDYSLDNISFSNSFRRKQRLRGSKRSYTNAAFDDHTAPSRVVNATSLHAALTDIMGIEAEFRAIPNVSATLDDIPQGAETKNRYANVIPMPDTRVLLTFQEDQPNSDYINANFVRGVNGEPKRYIITQGPLDDTAVDFWRMVWEQQVRVIFMLTDFAEGGIAKCADYYPRSETIDCSQLHGDFQVTLEKRDVAENCITSYLVVKDMERSLRRDVIHLWYHSWPDKGVPATAKPTADFLLKYRKFTKEPTPLLVHCSPGTGRSGTLVACDIAMKEFEAHQKVDIARTVLKIRQDRAGAVQTKEQYVHIYEVLHYYASRMSPTHMHSTP